MWVGTRKGLCIYRDGACKVPEWSAPFADVSIEAILHSASGSSWIGTTRGLYKVTDGHAEKVFGEPGSSSIEVITETRDGCCILWGYW